MRAKEMDCDVQFYLHFYFLPIQMLLKLIQTIFVHFIKIWLEEWRYFQQFYGMQFFLI